MIAFSLPRLHISGLNEYLAVNAPLEDGALPARSEIAEANMVPMRRWRPWRSKVLWAFTIALVATIVFDVRDSRDRRTAFRHGLKAFNRRWANPLILHFAGAAPWGVARLEVKGRRSGALSATPLWAEPVSGGFLITMPYGTDVDWAKNLIHADEGVLQYRGMRFRVGSPRIGPAVEALPELPFLTRLIVDLSGVRYIMHVDVLPSATAQTPAPA